MERRRALLAELRSYIDLTDEDAALLAAFRPLAQPHFPAIADEFYAVIRLHEGAFSVFKDEAQARRLHASLQVWLGELLGGPYDAAFVERHAHIGLVHVRVGLELRYMVTAMSRVRVALQRVAAETLTDERSSATRMAIARICDLDLAVMLESYKDHLLARIERTRALDAESIRSEMHDRERFHSDVLEAADVVVLGFGPDGRLAVVNPKAEQLTGFARDELAGGDVFELLFGPRAADMRAMLLSPPGERPVEVEAEMLTRSGKARIVRWHASAHQPSNGGPPTAVVVGVDVTHARELERRALQNERLAAAGALAAGLAHEIRNPLNGANLHVSVLERALARTPGVPDSAREAADVLRNEIRRLGSLVTDFLEVARPKPLARVEQDVNDIATSIGRLLAPEAEARKVAFAVHTFKFPAVARVDAERLKQVLVNLVRNGLEAVKEGGHVTVRVRRVPRHVEIDIEDDGPGIPNPTAPIFDAFYTTKDRGTGLGLSIVQRIVADHDGDVTFKSRPGETTFTVRLPA